MGKTVKFKWDIDVRLLTNRYIMGEVFKVLGIAAFIVAGFVGILALIQHSGNSNITYSSSNAQGFKYMIILLLIVFAATALLILIFYGNKYGLTYVVDSSGVVLKTRKNQKKKNNIINTLLLVLGGLAGNSSAVGVGIISRGYQDMALKWKNVRKIVYARRHNTIVLKGAYGVKTIVFCTPDNGDSIYNTICSYCSTIKPVVKD